MRPSAWFEELLASGENSDNQVANGIFECPQWRLLLRIVPAWGLLGVAGYSLVFRSSEPYVRRLVLLVALIWYVVAISRRVRRVRLEGGRLVADFGGGKPSRSWELHELSIDKPGHMWWQRSPVIRERESRRIAFTLLPDLAGWQKLATMIRDANAA